MPLSFFHSADGGIGVDRTGMELPELRPAHIEAARYAGDLVRDEPALMWERGQWQVTITDADDAHLFTIVAMVVNAGANDCSP